MNISIDLTHNNLYEDIMEIMLDTSINKKSNFFFNNKTFKFL